MLKPLPVLGMVMALVWAIACARPAVPPPPTPALSPTPSLAQSPSLPPLSPELEEGRGLFVSKGCVNCHGANLEFLVVVNLPELSPAAVMNQVRNPTGMMPSFFEAALNNEDLEKIARFVAAVLAQRAQPRP